MPDAAGPGRMRTLRLAAPLLLIAAGFVPLYGAATFDLSWPHASYPDLFVYWGAAWFAGLLWIFLEFRQTRRFVPAQVKGEPRVPGWRLALVATALLAYGYLPFLIIAISNGRGPGDCIGSGPCTLFSGLLESLWPGLSILLDLFVVIPIGLALLAVAVYRHAIAIGREGGGVTGPPAAQATPR